MRVLISMKARPTTRDQTRAPGLYDEQLQRLQQEKELEKQDSSEGPAKPAFFASRGK